MDVVPVVADQRRDSMTCACRGRLAWVNCILWHSEWIDSPLRFLDFDAALTMLTRPRIYACLGDIQGEH